MENGRMVLLRDFTRDGRHVLQRMVFEDIAAERFRWLWQRSDDEGRNWTTAWEIQYRRK
jgi:hypothetical protein